MKLHSPVCDILGIEYPIVLAGMGQASCPRLVAAVSEAGGLGVLGAAVCQPDHLRSWIREVRSLTDKPFGVDTLLPASVRRQADSGSSTYAPGESPQELMARYREVVKRFMEREKLTAVSDGEAGMQQRKGDLPLFSKEFFDAQMEVVIEEKVPVYASGLGNPGPWMDRLRANDTKVMAVVGAVRHAVQVVGSGLDIIIAQGHDAGGHNSPVGTMALLPQVVDAVKGTPVLGAGGITDGRGVAAAMMLGAQGAWIGSAFLASEEADIEDFQKQAIVDATEEGTTISRSVTGKPARIIKSSWTRYWEEAELKPLPMPWQSIIASPVLASANKERRGDINPGFAGQGIGMIRSVRPAADIFAEIVAGAENTLQTSANYLA